MPGANLVCLLSITIFHQSRNSIIVLLALLIRIFDGSLASHTCIQLTKEWFLRMSTTPSLASRLATNCSNVGWGMLWIIFHICVNFVLYQGIKYTDCGGMFKHFHVHSFVRETSDIVTCQTRDEINPVRIIPLATQPSDLIDI